MNWFFLVVVVGATVVGFAWTLVSRSWRLSTMVSVLATPAVAAAMVLLVLAALRSLRWIGTFAYDAGRGDALAAVALPVFALGTIPALVGAFVARLWQRRGNR